MGVKWNKSHKKRMEDATFRGLLRGGERVRNEAIRLILRTKKTGRVYYFRGRKHVASAPGEAPASRTGKLVRSIKVRRDRKKMRVRVVATAPYGIYLERGTRRMAKRPFLNPARNRMTKAVTHDIADEIRKELRKGKGRGKR